MQIREAGEIPGVPSKMSSAASAQTVDSMDSSHESDSQGRKEEECEDDLEHTGDQVSQNSLLNYPTCISRSLIASDTDQHQFAFGVFGDGCDSAIGNTEILET